MIYSISYTLLNEENDFLTKVKTLSLRNNSSGITEPDSFRGLAM